MRQRCGVQVASWERDRVCSSLWSDLCHTCQAVTKRTRRSRKGKESKVKEDEETEEAEKKEGKEPEQPKESAESQQMRVPFLPRSFIASVTFGPLERL